MLASMNWNYRFARRTQLMKRSAVRELLKLTAQPGMISFAGGLPAPELFPLEEIRGAAEAVLGANGHAALQYGETEGFGDLREWIAGRFSHGGVQIRRSQVLITTGAQQALDLLGRVFLNQGDSVLVENPTYLALLSAWRPWGVRFLAAVSDECGMRVDALEGLLKKRPKLIYAVPNFQNPQGTTLAAERRNRMVALLREHEVILIEDNPYGDLRYAGEPLPHLLQIDGGVGRVLHVGTFSKTVAPGLRVGWIIAPEPVIEKLVMAKQAADLHTSTLCQHLLLALLRTGLLEARLPRLRQVYLERRNAMLAGVEANFPTGTTWTRPEGGMFLMVNLPAEMEAAALLKPALEAGVAFVPGEEFHLDGVGRNTLRLNFSNASLEQIESGMKRLGAVLGRRQHGRRLFERIAAER